MPKIDPDKPVGRKIYCAQTVENSPVIKLYTRELRNGVGEFLLDSGAEVNAIRIDNLPIGTPIDSSRKLALRGAVPINSIGTVKLQLFGKPHEFQVWTDESTIQDNILGDPFFKVEKARIDYQMNALIIQSKPIEPIPFISEINSEEEHGRKSNKSANVVVTLNIHDTSNNAPTITTSSVTNESQSPTSDTTYDEYTFPYSDEEETPTPPTHETHFRTAGVAFGPIDFSNYQHEQEPQ